MRYPPDHAEATRARVLEASGQQFRTHGFGGVGVDGLARSGGVTSGAFYNHFGSKAGAFAAVVAAGIERLRASLEQIRAARGDDWQAAFAAAYLSVAHRNDPGAGCVLPSLSVDTGRADAPTRDAYQAGLLEVARLLSDGLPGEPGRDAAWPILALLVGGVVLSRAVPDPALAEEIAAAVRQAAIPPGRPESGGAPDRST